MNLLFPSETGTWQATRTLYDSFDKAKIAIGRPTLTPHALRHSGLSWMAQSGATVAELMKVGGHTTPAVSARYQHASADRLSDLADKLAARRPARDNVVPIDRGKAS